MKTLFELIGLIIVGIAGAVFIAFFFLYFVALFGLIVVAFIIANFCGVPITIKQSGKVIGYVKYGKFIRV